MWRTSEKAVRVFSAHCYLQYFGRLNLKKFLMLALLSVMPVSVFADNLYGSISLGHVNTADLTGDGGVPKGASIRLLLGFDFNQYLAAEIGYSSLLTNAGYSSTTLTNASVTLNVQEIAAIGKWPINDLVTVFGRVGYAFMSTVGNSSQSSTGSSILGYTFSSPGGIVWGPGMIYKINNTFDVRAGYNIYVLSGALSGEFNSTTNGTSTSGLLAGSGDIIATDTYISAALHF